MKAGEGHDPLSRKGVDHLAADWTKTSSDDLTTPGPTSTWPVLPRYEIIGELGHGNMGVVYKARELQTGRLVALKVMQRVDAVMLARFKQEFRVLQEVSHRNL